MLQANGTQRIQVEVRKMTGLRTSSLSLAALVVVLAAPAATATTAPTTKQPAVPIERMALDAPRVAYAKEWHAQLAAGSLPTAVSSRYAGLSGGPLLRIGNTIYAGAVNRLATPTGPAVVVSAESGKAETVRTHVAGGSVRAAIADGAGGWYLGGTFSSVGGVARGGLAHVRADGTLDTAFDPPAGLGQVRALALDAGRLTSEASGCSLPLRGSCPSCSRSIPRRGRRCRFRTRPSETSPAGRWA